MDELKILIVGLDYAGKTSLLEQVKRAYISHYGGSALEGLPPTIGMNLARVATQRVDVMFWDVGGSVRGRVACAPSEGVRPVRPRSPHASLTHRTPTADARHLGPLLLGRGWPRVCD